jgi:hypothetical protein
MVESLALSILGLGGLLVQELLRELLTFVEGNSKWWEEAAQNCADLANKRSDEEAAWLFLLCAVYHERAKLHRNIVAKMRQRSES